MAVLLSNNATTVLSVAVEAGDTVLSVPVDDAAKFPVPTVAGAWFPLTIIDPLGQMEIVHCTARDGTALTVTRAREGTAARDFPAGSRADLRLTAAALADFRTQASNAANLTSGTVPSARLSGSYTGIVGVGALNAGSISSGFGNINIGTATFTGNGSGLSSLNASNLTAGTLPNARLAGNYSFENLSLTTRLTCDNVYMTGGVAYFSSNDWLSFSATTNIYTFLANSSPQSSTVVAGKFGRRGSGTGYENWDVTQNVEAVAVGIISSTVPCGLGAATNDAAALQINRFQTAGAVAGWRYNGTVVGTISCNSSSTSYNTTSDERKKEDFQPIDVELIDQINVYDFKWIDSDERGQGVKAQETFSVFPNAISYDPNEDLWGADYSKFVPLLLAVVKHQRGQIADLLARVATLEGS
ncbi:tail fiber domain-containing protein [Shinella pollutisoli]|uniref:Tail fiber domain-containing protein n=1 Tax=Shinella pollutisoli TaxID=2250594 RepID=A0ABV7DKY3_9HYPH|nr:tail fiber domain-containing protein [Shinella pollutisoli]